MPDVSSKLCFVADSPHYKGGKPLVLTPGEHYDFLDAAAKSRRIVFEEERVTLHDIRNLGNVSLKTHGFEVLNHSSTCTPVIDDESASEYQREIEEILKIRFRAEKVVCFDIRVCRYSSVMKYQHETEYIV